MLKTNGMPSDVEWKLICDFAHTFSFETLWLEASGALSNDVDVNFMSLISIGRRTFNSHLVAVGIEGFARSSGSIPPPGSKDAEVLGYDGLAAIIRLRYEQHQENPRDLLDSFRLLLTLFDAF